MPVQRDATREDHDSVVVRGAAPTAGRERLAIPERKAGHSTGTPPTPAAPGGPAAGNSHWSCRPRPAVRARPGSADRSQRADAAPPPRRRRCRCVGSRARSCRPPPTRSAVRPWLFGAQALHKRADHGVKSIRVDGPEHAADGRLRRAPRIGSEQSRDVVGHVGDPLGDRDERPRTGRDSADPSGEHDDQAVADTPPLARIDHPAQRVRQARREHDRIGQLHPAHLANDSSDRQR
jgi:hypothetical protein